VLGGAVGLVALIALAGWVRYLRSPGYVLDATIRALNGFDMMDWPSSIL